MGENIAIGSIIFIVFWGLALVGYVMYINIFGHGAISMRRFKSVFKKSSGKNSG